MTDRIGEALKTAEAAFEVAAENTVAISGMRALLPFAIAGRMPTSEELAEIVSNLIPPAAEVSAPVEAQAIRNWIFAVLADARAVSKNSRS